MSLAHILVWGGGSIINWVCNNFTYKTLAVPTTCAEQQMFSEANIQKKGVCINKQDEFKYPCMNPYILVKPCKHPQLSSAVKQFHQFIYVLLRKSIFKLQNRIFRNYWICNQTLENKALEDINNLSCWGLWDYKIHNWIDLKNPSNFTYNKARSWSWAVPRFQGSNFSHDLSLVGLKLFILCNSKLLW